MRKYILTSEAGDILNKIDNYFPKPIEKTRLAIIRTAERGDVNKSWYIDEINKWNDFGFVNYDEIYLEEYDETSLLEELNRFDVIYVVGGHIHYLLSHMQRVKFKDVLDRLNNVYVGNCAGAVVLGKDIYHIKQIDCYCKYDLESAQALGLLDKRIYAHSDYLGEACENSYGSRYYQTIFKNPQNDNEALCIRDNEAIVVQGNNITNIK